MQAYQDLAQQLGGLTLRRSRHGADPLIAAEAAAAAARGQLLAVLTDDSDFYVLGGSCAPRLIHTHGVVVDPAGSVTLMVWDTRCLWLSLAKAAAAGRGAAATAAGGAAARASEPSLLRRAQVAAVLGNDLSQDVRRRLQARKGAVVGARRLGGGGCYAAGPSEVAREVLRLPAGAAPDLNFFQQPPVGLKSFGPEDLEAYNAVVQVRSAFA